LNALSIRQLEKRYANGFQALKGISLDVEAGDFFALLGPNGAGKSTAIGIIASLINKSAGEVAVFGRDLEREREAAKQQIGLVPQEFNFNQWEPVVEILVNQAGYYGIPRKEAFIRAEKSLKRLDLWEKRTAQARSLSGGMKRRLMIARALVHRPRLLILDEPTAGVDIEIRRSMWDFLREINSQGTTIILTTHYLEEAENLCRNIGIINHGEIVEQTRLSSLLSQLQTETFVLDLQKNLDQPPDIDRFPVRLTASNQLEVDVLREQNLNLLFSELAGLDIQVTSMRNKQNRLEQLFIDLVDASRVRKSGGRT
jgi:ABC-2 type transport system ATP-binding protein